MNDRNGRFNTIYTGKPNNVRHVVNTVNPAQFGIGNATPCTTISVHCVNFVERRKRMSLMRVNKRKHVHDECFSTRFSTRVCTKIVRAFCLCVGRLSLTCTVKQL